MTTGFIEQPKICGLLIMILTYKCLECGDGGKIGIMTMMGPMSKLPLMKMMPLMSMKLVWMMTIMLLMADGSDENYVAG